MKKCINCKYFIQKRKYKEKRKEVVLGECKDAIPRAREFVPFAVCLSVTMIYGDGGKDCPTFERKK